MSSFGRTAGNLFFKAAPAIGGYIDYARGKAEGEDDVRAAAGAVGSTLGGWATTAAATKAGAAAGAAIGTAIAPVAGTTIGGAIGGLAGFGAGLVTQGLGSFAGGWTADRLDETVRGKPAQANTGVRNMSNIVETQDGRLAEVDDNGNFLSWVVPAIALGIAGDGLYRVGQEAATNYDWNKTAFDLANPSGVGRFNNTAAAQQTLGNARQVVGQGLRNTGDDIARVWNKIPGSTPVKAIGLSALALDQAFGGNVTKAIGRGIAGGADTIANTLGFRTDFDGKNQQSQEAIRRNKEVAREEQNKDIIDAYNRAIYEHGFRNRQEAEDYENRLWNREAQEAREIFQKRDDIARRNFMTEFTAKQAVDMLNNYAEMPESVARGIAAIYQAAR